MRHFPRATDEAASGPAAARTAARRLAATTEAHPVTLFTIRLVERTTQQGVANFEVDAPTASVAASIVAEAHARAQALGINMVTLPDGQTQVLEAEDVVARDRRFLLLDAAGTEVAEIALSDGPSRPQ